MVFGGILVMIGWNCHWEWEEYLLKPCHEKYGGPVSPEDIDLIVSDIKMPRFDGIKLHEFARQMERHRHTKFVFITSTSSALLEHTRPLAALPSSKGSTSSSLSLSGASMNTWAPCLTAASPKRARESAGVQTSTASRPAAAFATESAVAPPTAAARFRARSA